LISPFNHPLTQLDLPELKNELKTARKRAGTWRWSARVRNWRNSKPPEGTSPGRYYCLTGPDKDAISVETHAPEYLGVQDGEQVSIRGAVVEM
jgi:hypothetical protein